MVIAPTIFSSNPTNKQAKKKANKKGFNSPIKEFAKTIVPELKSNPDIVIKEMDEAAAKVSNAVAFYRKSPLDNTGSEYITLNPIKIGESTINDTLGYEQGDAQIKAAANVLIKTQLDNTDIMRTDGNEYLIYLVGYQEKQVVSYIRKLYKEFKNLPYEHGAAIGYSMITNDIKTIEDAINESVEDMRNKKEELENS